MRKPGPDDFFFDSKLREVPKDPVFIDGIIDDYRALLKRENSPEVTCKILGELGVYLRIQGHLDEAETALRQALKIIGKSNLGLSSEVQQKIRLAHVLQWKKSYLESNRIFVDLVFTDYREHLKIVLLFAR